MDELQQGAAQAEPRSLQAPVRSPAATAPARGGWGVWPGPLGARLEQEMLGERISAAEQ